MTNDEDTPNDFERALASAGQAFDEHYVLRLYVTGITPRSTQAFATIKALCDEHLVGRYELEVIDIYQHPELAVHDQIIAAPTLVKRRPLPLCRIIGDLSDTERVLHGLALRPSR